MKNKFSQGDRVRTLIPIEVSAGKASMDFEQGVTGVIQCSWADGQYNVKFKVTDTFSVKMILSEVDIESMP